MICSKRKVPEKQGRDFFILNEIEEAINRVIVKRLILEFLTALTRREKTKHFSLFIWVTVNDDHNYIKERPNTCTLFTKYIVI